MLLISPELISEVKEVLERPRIGAKYSLTVQEISDFVARLQRTAEPVVPLDPLPVRSRDPKDDKFLAVALGGAADYLLTGDDDLLVLDGDPALGSLRIITVRAFLDLLEQ